MADQKVALITGASSGIGAATAIHFAKLGYKLAICGRNAAALAETTTHCLEANDKLSADSVLQLAGDMSVEKDCEDAVKKAVEKFNRLDVLIPCAGILTTGPLETISLDEYDNLMNINCRSIILLMKLCTPHLIETKGNIVNVSSVTGLRAFPGVLSYCISKAAVDQLTRCSALELAPKGVRVNAVNPGVIITHCHKRAGMTEEAYAKFLEHSKTTHALGRPGTADEVAKAIAFLASDDASFITGVTLPVDGGRGIMCPR
ncbi:3-oxoacyl-[acyl-carrier-protein] reductase FabG-like [Daphnia carinata]|uniref:3-oxoacyl-[acyl-carrier-protein] reductase FabG-like n=1 Tax=Daphnia carinata TaxID=120202 RepID=UPI0025801141|nr:3-oxoacyl-[acyl-carrier-protein] reductase FabG-like [Daphnia carinata]